MAGYEVFAGHLHSSGFIVKRRCRVQSIDVVGTASAGLLEIWDTDVAPVAGTYGRSGTTVTVTKTGHGLSSGDTIGISFTPNTGVNATSGNYEITVTDANTFTITDINTGTINTGTACRYVSSNTNDSDSRWLTTYHTAASDIFVNNLSIPGDGLLARKGVYVSVTNLDSVNIFYA
jgi:hypothetical protein